MTENMRQPMRSRRKRTEEKITLQDWQERYHACSTPKERAEWIGCSPGGAAATLGISRNTLHQWVYRGKLRLIEIVDQEGHFVGQYIPDAEVARALHEHCGVPEREAWKRALSSPSSKAAS
jgi:hypothetical protein